MAFGDKEGAVGYLVGEENRGLEYMFIMMNLARFGSAWRAWGSPSAPTSGRVDYARDRVQGARRAARGRRGGNIIEHPDVRRMLMTMRAHTEAMRALGYVTAAALDNARRHPDADARKPAQAFVDLMIPIVKGWSTEIGQRSPRSACRSTAAWASSRRPAPRSTCATRASRRSTKARPASRPTTWSAARSRAMEVRRARRDRDDARRARKLAAAARTSSPPSASACTRLDALEERRAGSSAPGDDPRAVLAGAGPFLELAGTVCGGAQLARAALAAARTTCGRRWRRRFPAREDCDRAPFCRTLSDEGAGVARHRRRRRGGRARARRSPVLTARVDESRSRSHEEFADRS